MLKIENLSASYKTIDGNIHVVKDVDFEIRDNEIFGIAGESGCGKSTLLKTLYDIVEFPLEIDKGRVVLSGVKNGKEFSYQSGEIRKCWWNNISYVPQAAQSVLNPIVRLKEQFLDSIPDEDKKNETEQQTLARVAKYLEELGLSPDVLEAFPFQLSGGMRQRAIIALATFMSPNVVLADEPTTALDVVVQKGILMMLMRLQQQFNIPGRPPALKNPPPGCRFAARCPNATDKCRAEVPTFREIKPGRFAACHYLESEVN